LFSYDTDNGAVSSNYDTRTTACTAASLIKRATMLSTDTPIHPLSVSQPRRSV